MQRSNSTKSPSVNGFTTVSEHHLFYMNPKDNIIKPPWYINCSRKDAEEILKKHREYGNVLIRPNSNFAVNGSYALSAVTISGGENKYVHYVISRATDGFKLEVQSKPPSMACLQDVLDYYIKAAGCQTHHAMVIDPTEISNTKPSRRNPVAAKKTSDYVNLPESSGTGLRTSAPVDESIYIPMTGSSSRESHAIMRRNSAPVNNHKRDYVNMPKATGAYPKTSDHYINGNELGFDEPKGHGHDYINVATVVPGRTSRPRSPNPMLKANSFPVAGRDVQDDDEDEDDYILSPTYMAPPPPIFSDDIRPSSIHEAPGF